MSKRKNLNRRRKVAATPVARPSRHTKTVLDEAARQAGFRITADDTGIHVTSLRGTPDPEFVPRSN